VKSRAPILPACLQCLSFNQLSHTTISPGGTPCSTATQEAAPGCGLLMAIPYGETPTYKEEAASIGKPSAMRAVAHACATNPVSLVIPCHRVVRTTGNLAGYRWGVGRKQALLAAEHRMKDR